MSAERIKSAALARFATQGYDATSLAELAGDAGIKTPSIYAHFRSKEALFWQLVEESADREIDRIRSDLCRPEPIRATMRRYLWETVARFATEPHLQFWLRSIYLPPTKMRDAIGSHDREFSVALEEVVSSALRHPEYGLHDPVLPYETLATGFIGILRSVHAELLYSGSQDSTKVLTALWTIFERSLVDGAQPGLPALEAICRT